MKKTLLLPHRYKFIGWGLLAGAIILWALTAIVGIELSFLRANTFAILSGELIGKSNYFAIVDMDLTNTLNGCLFIAGGLLVTFSKEKIEDEFIMKLRLSSLKWAVLIHYLVLLALFLFVHGFYFLMVMVYNMFTVLILFILRFHYLLIKHRVNSNEE